MAGAASAAAASAAALGGFYNNRLVEQYASVETKKITLNQLMAFGRHMNEHKLLKSGNYVRKELCVRLGSLRGGGGGGRWVVISSHLISSFSLSLIPLILLIL